MRTPTRNGEGLLNFDMTPMIDVVFLLIIFFLVSSHLARQETQVELDLPTAKSGETPSESPRPRATINLMASGEIQMGGAILTTDELTGRLKQAAEDADEPLEVRLRGDRRVTYDAVEPVLVACAKAGVWNITLAVTPN